MGLGEDRYIEGWLEVESTFRMVRLHKLLTSLHQLSFHRKICCSKPVDSFHLRNW
jgi:hypothetical protein